MYMAAVKFFFTSWCDCGIKSLIYFYILYVRACIFVMWQFGGSNHDYWIVNISSKKPYSVVSTDT